MAEWVSHSLFNIGIDYLIIDEAALIPRNTYEMYLRPTLSDKKGKAIFISTPDGYSYFHELYLRGKSKINDYMKSQKINLIEDLLIKFVSEKNITVVDR